MRHRLTAASVLASLWDIPYILSFVFFCVDIIILEDTKVALEGGVQAWRHHWMSCREPRHLSMPVKKRCGFSDIASQQALSMPVGSRTMDQRQSFYRGPAV